MWNPIPGYVPSIASPRRLERQPAAQRRNDPHSFWRSGHRAAVPDGFLGDRLTTEPIEWSTGQEPFAADVVLWAVGHARPNNAFIPPEMLDEQGFVKVDEYCRTGEPGVYAIGDIINTPQLAHVGYAEAVMVVKHLLGEDPMPVMYDRVPWAIYCHPEVSFAGHSEESAKEAGYEVVANKHRFIGNGRAVILGETDGLVKVIAEKRPDGSGGKILGVHMVGPWVTEQLGAGYFAVNWEATVDEVAELIQPHPSMSELFGETVIALTGRSLH